MPEFRKQVGGRCGDDSTAGGDGPKKQEVVVADPVAKAGQGRVEEDELGALTVWRGCGGEVGEIVPGGGCDPSVFRLVHLSANVSGGVGDAKSSDSPNVDEHGVKHLRRDETVAEILMNGGGSGKEISFRDLEEKLIVIGVDGRNAALDEEMMNGAPAFKFGDGESGCRGANGGGFQPIDGATRLGVVVSGISFEFVNQIRSGKCVFVKLGIE